MRFAMFSAVAGWLLISSAACAPKASNGSVASTSADRMPRITALYEQATARPVRPFRKPVRDQQARARRELQAECQLWLAELRAEATPTALTGPGNVKPTPSARAATALQFSLEQLSSSAGQADSSSMRVAHSQAVAAYRRVEGDRSPEMPAK